MYKKLKGICSFIVAVSMLLSLCVMPAAAANPTGDANGDGNVNTVDRAFISRHIAKWKGYETLDGGDAADTNGDGNINTLDRAAISRHIAKWSGYDIFEKDKVETGSGTALVDSVDVTTGKITFKEKYTTNEYINNSYVIVNDTAKLTVNGYDAKVSDLHEYDVLYITTDNLSNPTVLEIEAIRNEVWGTVAEKDSVSMNVAIYDKMEYKQQYALNLNFISFNDIKLGGMGIYYLDKDNNIVGYREQNINLENTFAVITDYSYDETSGGLRVRYYKQGGYNTRTVAENVEIDGDICSGDSITDILDSINSTVSFYGSDATGIPAIIRLDKNWKIEYIDSAVVGEDETEESLHYVNKTDESIGSVISDASYKKNTNMFNGMYYISSSSPVLTIPSDYRVLNDERSVSYTKAGNLASTESEDTRYDVALFTDQSTAYKASYAVIIKPWQKHIYTELTDTDGTERHDKQMHIVQTVARTWDEDEDKPTLKIYAITEGNEVELTFDPDYANSLNENYPTANLSYAVENMYFGAGLTYPSDDYPNRKNGLIQEGDVIRVRQNEYGQVAFIDFIWMMEEKIFCCDDAGTVGGSGMRYRAFDIGFAKNYLDGMLELQYMMDKRRTPYGAYVIKQFFFDSNKYPMLTVDGDVFVSNSSASDYSADISLWEDKVLMTCYPIPATSFKIMTYDADERSGSRVGKGSTRDLILAVDKKAPSIVIIQYRSYVPRGMYIINL